MKVNISLASFPGLRHKEAAEAALSRPLHENHIGTLSADHVQLSLFLSAQVYAVGAWIHASGQKLQLSEYPEIKKYAAMLERNRCRLLGMLGDQI